MVVICSFCGKEKKLTTHHLVAQKYMGNDDQSNLRPDICRDCHNQIEGSINKSRGDLGAGKNTPLVQNFMVGSVQAQLNNGSIYLDEQGQGHIDVGSPFYGMSCHIKNHGQKQIEIALSGGSVVFISGSLGNSWLIYSYANNGTPHLLS